MAPRMNQVISAARSLGVMIIHAPSDTMKYYEGTPQRLRMQQAPTAASTTPILARCPRDSAEERSFPIDDTKGVCDDPILKNWTGPYPWTREHPGLDIVGFDGVSDNGQEISTTAVELAKEAINALPYSLSPDLSGAEAEAVVNSATPMEACQKAHSNGWEKGFLVGGLIVLGGFAKSPHRLEQPQKNGTLH